MSNIQKYCVCDYERHIKENFIKFFAFLRKYDFVQRICRPFYFFPNPIKRTQLLAAMELKDRICMNHLVARCKYKSGRVQVSCNFVLWQMGKEITSLAVHRENKTFFSTPSSPSRTLERLLELTQLLPRALYSTCALLPELQVIQDTVRVCCAKSGGPKTPWTQTLIVRLLKPHFFFVPTLRCPGPPVRPPSVP